MKCLLLRRVDEVEAFDIGNADMLHGQNDARQTSPADFRFSVFQTITEIFLGEHPIALAGTSATCTASTLVAASL